MKKRILIADDIAAEGLDYLRAQKDLETQRKINLDGKRLRAAVKACHAVIVRSATAITAEVIAAAPRLTVIGRAGIGVDNIDVAAATARGIAVLNTPDANATTTAELTLAHILSLSRNLPQADRSVKAGAWERSRFIGAELANKTLGLIGYGTIGRIVAARARALNMEALVHDPFVNEERLRADGVRGQELEALLAAADYVSLHCPLTESTRRILNADRLRLMKPGARLINCARGGLIDEDALAELLAAGRLAGAALDVYEHEPPGDSPLLDLDNIVLTPHLGASTREAQAAAGLGIARQVAAYLQTGEPINAVNLPPVSAEEARGLHAYLVLSRRLGRMLAAMVPGPVAELEVSLWGDAAERDSKSIAAEALAGLLSAHMSAAVNRVNARLIGEQQGIHIIEARHDHHPDYHTVVGVTARYAGKEADKRDDKSTTLMGTLFDRQHPRLVRIDHYDIEAFLQGHLLLSRHLDKPGALAAICAALAERKINIARMQLGIVADSDKAVALIEVSRPLRQELMDELQRIDAVTETLQVSLP